MIRAIDATELKTAFPLGEYVRTECVQATIDYMQTIEAIPIEWLYQKMQQEGERDNILHAEYIKDLIFEWKKEQEDNKYTPACEKYEYQMGSSLAEFMKEYPERLKSIDFSWWRQNK